MSVDWRVREGGSEVIICSCIRRSQRRIIKNDSKSRRDGFCGQMNAILAFVCLEMILHIFFQKKTSNINQIHARSRSQTKVTKN